MATYKEIQAHVKRNHIRSVKTCWIAHVKELNDLPLRPAPNRLSYNKRKHPCPGWARPLIENSIRELGMI
ncbi:MAG: hypothetical protein ACFFCW_05065 [Candidatus Hodarchaeota archaeon]